MDYEQKYKEALEKARQLCAYPTTKPFISDLQDLFPELKESENEKVIRDIKVVLECSATKFFKEEGKMPIWYDRAVAWLEKQGESDETKAKEFLINKGYPIDTNDAFPTYEEMYNIIREGLEKQGEQKPSWSEDDEENMNNVLYILNQLRGTSSYNDDFAENTINWIKSLKDKLYSSNEYDKDMLGAIEYCIKNNRPFEKEHIAWLLYKQGDKAIKEEKADNVNKVEPKFKVGDWIVFNGLTLYINEVVKGYYRTISKDGIPNSYDWDIDAIARPWTIKEARDGDVLCVKYGNNEMPFIFTGKQKGVAYCSLNSFGEFVLSMADWLLKTSVSPATKKQRDLLFQKMQEAGYKWNEEKKVVEKINPKFKVGDWIVSTLSGSAYKIIGLSCSDYEIISDDGYKGNLDIKIVDDNFNLWTIENAKDGDVLCTYECGEPKIVFILKGTPKKPYVLSYYCYYNIMHPHFMTYFEKGCLAPNIEDVKPATKEQRDLLFQKMKESGYEWDDNKKELKEEDYDKR